MKRVKSACLCQTIHFMLKEDMPHGDACKLVEEDAAQYQKSLERNHTRYKVIDKVSQPDGSIVLKVVKQYNSYPVGDYLE